MVCPCYIHLRKWSIRNRSRRTPLTYQYCEEAYHVMYALWSSISSTAWVLDRCHTECLIRIYTRWNPMLELMLDLNSLFMGCWSSNWMITFRKDESNRQVAFPYLHLLALLSTNHIWDMTYWFWGSIRDVPVDQSVPTAVWGPYYLSWPWCNAPRRE